MSCGLLVAKEEEEDNEVQSLFFFLISLIFPKGKLGVGPLSPFLLSFLYAMFGKTQQVYINLHNMNITNTPIPNPIPTNTLNKPISLSLSVSPSLSVSISVYMFLSLDIYVCWLLFERKTDGVFIEEILIE